MSRVGLYASKFDVVDVVCDLMEETAPANSAEDGQIKNNELTAGNFLIFLFCIFVLPYF